MRKNLPGRLGFLRRSHRTPWSPWASDKLNVSAIEWRCKDEQLTPTERRGEWMNERFLSHLFVIVLWRPSTNLIGVVFPLAVNAENRERKRTPDVGMGFPFRSNWKSLTSTQSLSKDQHWNNRRQRLVASDRANMRLREKLFIDLASDRNRIGKARAIVRQTWEHTRPGEKVLGCHDEFRSNHVDEPLEKRYRRSKRWTEQTLLICCRLYRLAACFCTQPTLGEASCSFVRQIRASLCRNHQLLLDVSNDSDTSSVLGREEPWMTRSNSLPAAVTSLSLSLSDEYNVINQ